MRTSSIPAQVRVPISDDPALGIILLVPPRSLRFRAEKRGKSELSSTIASFGRHRGTERHTLW
jgi:hypothetical protein